VAKVSAHELTNELIFTFSRSGGAGGQHVNKVSTKVTLRWDVSNSALLTTDQKEIVLKKLGSKLTNEGVLILISQESRSQIQNKEFAILKLDELLKKAFTPRKARKATKPTKASVHRRIEVKKLKGEKKQWRKRLE
jgi:ribosome-associated protein